VWRIVAVSCDAIGARSLFEMAARHPHLVAPCAGLHPAVRAVVDNADSLEPPVLRLSRHKCLWFLIGIACRVVHARWLQNFARLANADAAAAKVELDATMALIGECHARLVAIGEVRMVACMIGLACCRMLTNSEICHWSTISAGWIFRHGCSTRQTSKPTNRASVPRSSGILMRQSSITCRWCGPICRSREKWLKRWTNASCFSGVVLVLAHRMCIHATPAITQSLS
jgi:hypothetical protein